jgi:hypothetical protein
MVSRLTIGEGIVYKKGLQKKPITTGLETRFEAILGFNPFLYTILVVSIFNPFLYTILVVSIFNPSYIFTDKKPSFFKKLGLSEFTHQTTRAEYSY